MSQPSPTYLDRVRRWIVGGLDIESMNMRLDQKFRALLVHEAYAYWLQDKVAAPRTIITSLARKHYQLYLQQARLGNEDAKMYVDALHITEGVDRSYNEISNDIYLFNYMVGELAVPMQHIHKQVFTDGAMWLIRHGMNTGDGRDVERGLIKLAMINNNFKDDENPQDQMPNTNINITGDVSIIKPDKQSLPDAEKERLRKKYGLTTKELAQQMEEIDGVWQPVEQEETSDVFDENL